jgi:phage-related protein
MSVIPEVVYFKKGEREPVADYIELLDDDAAAKVRAHIRALAAEGPLSPSLDARHLGEGLWELKVRSKMGHHRLFYCVHNGVLWLLHAITKKSGKTPRNVLALARRRKKEAEEE